MTVSAITAPATLAIGPSERSTPRVSTTRNCPSAMSASGRALTLSDRTSKGVKRPLRAIRTANKPTKTNTGQLSPIERRLARAADIRLSRAGRSDDRGAHDAIDSNVIAGQFDVDATLQHDDDAMNDADQLARIGRIPDDSDAARAISAISA